MKLKYSLSPPNLPFICRIHLKDTTIAGGRVFPYLGYMGTYRRAGYGLLAPLSLTGYGITSREVVTGHYKAINQHEIIFWTKMLLLSVYL